jgi:hypothetical protein
MNNDNISKILFDVPFFSNNKKTTKKFLKLFFENQKWTKINVHFSNPKKLFTKKDIFVTIIFFKVRTLKL